MVVFPQQKIKKFNFHSQFKVFFRFYVRSKSQNIAVVVRERKKLDIYFCGTLFFVSVSHPKVDLAIFLQENQQIRKKKTTFVPSSPAFLLGPRIIAVISGCLLIQPCFPCSSLFKDKICKYLLCNITLSFLCRWSSLYFFSSSS